MKAAIRPCPRESLSKKTVVLVVGTRGVSQRRIVTLWRRQKAESGLGKRMSLAAVVAGTAGFHQVRALRE